MLPLTKRHERVQHPQWERRAIAVVSPAELGEIWGSRAVFERFERIVSLDNNRVFEDVGVWDSAQVTLTEGEPERVEALMVTDGMLPLLRVQPARGRLFRKEDDAPGSPPRVLLSCHFWQRKFGGVDDIVRQRLEVNGRPREIVGVLPSSFKFLSTDPAVLLPMQLDRANVWVVFNFQDVAQARRHALNGQRRCGANDSTSRRVGAEIQRMAVAAERTPAVRRCDR